MSKLQKLNILKSKKADFNSRLNELRAMNLPLDDSKKQVLFRKKEALAKAIHFCNYLIMILNHNQDLGPDNLAMLSFIGLNDLVTNN